MPDAIFALSSNDRDMSPLWEEYCICKLAWIHGQNEMGIRGIFESSQY